MLCIKGFVKILERCLWVRLFFLRDLWVCDTRHLEEKIDDFLGYEWNTILMTQWQNDRLFRNFLLYNICVMIKNPFIEKFITLTHLDKDEQFQNIMDMSYGKIDWERIIFKVFPWTIEILFPFRASIKDFGKLKNNINYWDIKLRVHSWLTRPKIWVEALCIINRNQVSKDLLVKLNNGPYSYKDLLTLI